MDSTTIPRNSAWTTPSSSPGLFSPSNSHRQSIPAFDHGTPHSSPYLHPLQMHKVRETHKAQVEQDFITGRKLINQYEIIDEIGRGVHGKVKLARSLETQGYVAIKIIQRFSKKRRLGRVTVSPEDKTKREIAILKKIRHPNVVGLLEVIDDPELKKIYMVLEHVELGEIVWRRKGVRKICLYERRRIEREIRGEDDQGNDEAYFETLKRRSQRKEMKRAKLLQFQGNGEFWSLEHGDDDDEEDRSELPPLSRVPTRDSFVSLSHTSLVRSNPGSIKSSRATSRAPTAQSSRAPTPLPGPVDYDIGPLDSDNEDDAPSSYVSHASALALEGTMYGSYAEDPMYRGRSPSMADSIISHMSSIDDMTQHDAFEDDFSYVPCFTLDQARSAFRDTVLGLEYLHYEGIVHRDIKPANLLWTKGHRVKISDFGVSYFGRPIREGETEENISEADATDFDDDLELAKTVGTPAFFAPELCYTDIDVEQPKVTEQIDVWSLGITLYCLIYARIPFMAEDEYQLFKAIAKEDVYIPRRRLKAVDPGNPTSHFSRRMGPWDGPYRDEGDLSYEEIDNELYDLLRRMLIKDPAERIKLREVKRHPWTLKGIDNIIGWLDDTDPSRKAAGRRIEVDRSELERAVVPISLLERARSTFKKTLGKVTSVMRNDRSEGSRKRATSNATNTSSGAENSTHPLPPYTPILREMVRRASLRGDEYFSNIGDSHHDHHKEPTEHPLAQSQTASPDSASGDPLQHDFPISSPVGATPKRSGSSLASSNFDARPGPPERTISGTPSIATVVHRGHSYSRSVNHAFSGSPPADECPRTPGPFTDHMGQIFGGHLWNPRGRESLTEIDESASSRARSVDRGLFNAEDKHASASIAMSTAVAPGLFEHPRPTYQSESSPINPYFDKPLPSPLFFQPYIFDKHQTVSSASTPNVMSTQYAASILENRPATANRTPEGKTPAPRTFGASTPESFQRAQEQLDRRRKLEADANAKRLEFHSSNLKIETTTSKSCPLSPDDEIFAQKQEDASKRARSYSSVNSTSIVSPGDMTSPSDVNSPISSVALGSQEQFFPSVPSLPALVSGSSSVSADPEGDMLQDPDMCPPETVYDTSETLTPPMFSKQSSENEASTISDDHVAIHPAASHPYADTDEEGYNGDGDNSMNADVDDSDSDEGLTMMRKKPRAKLAGMSSSHGRRGTNASVGSTDTAKKVSMEG
ncbi:hypothetical protein MFRU_026g00010 [Monilinia fructicola]|nr:hypothetical protein MFRU_026g00010 [Monilinia fructicola]